MAWSAPGSLADRVDERWAFQARAQGDIRSLEQLLAELDRQIPGRLLKAKLDDDDGVPVYEIRWQLSDGRRLEMDIDARDGRWLKLKGPRLETVFSRSSSHDDRSRRGAR